MVFIEVTGIIFIVAVVVLCTVIVLSFIDNDKCLKNVSDSQSKCRKGYPDCSNVSKYCSTDEDECDFDIKHAVNDMCPDDYVKRRTTRLIISSIALLIGFITGLILLIAGLSSGGGGITLPLFN
jgi:hypothetical protein